MAEAIAATAPPRRRQLFWPAFALPGVSWLVALFLLPIYAVGAVTFGGIDPVLRSTADRHRHAFGGQGVGGGQPEAR